MAELQALRVAGESRDLPGFLKLPYELRQRIYRECLIEPELWYRPHSPTCPLTAKDTGSTERPAFVKRALIDHRLDDCKCTLRRGLVLLRVSRLINREAAPVFWSQNTFCFVHPADFCYYDFCDRVRPAHQLLIRHVCVMPYIGDSVVRAPSDYHYRADFRPVSEDYVVSLWRSLLACQGLRTLELHDGLLYGQLHMHVSRMRANLPHLHTFRLVSLLTYKVWPAQEEVDKLAALKWSKNPLHAKSLRHGNFSERDGEDADLDDDNGENDGLDDDLGLDVPIAPIADLGSMMPNHHTTHVAAPPPPPPPVRHLALNPIMPGYQYKTCEDFSRLLWFKVGVTVSDAVIDALTRGTTPTRRLFPPPMDARVVKRTADYYNDPWAAYRANAEDEDEDEEEEEDEDDDDDEEADDQDNRTPQQVADATAAEDAFRDMLRSFRTNFLVHMRHAIQQDLPYEWSAQQGHVAPLPLRDMDALPPKKTKKDMRIRIGCRRLVTVDSPGFACSKYGTVRRFLRSSKTYYEMHYQWEYSRYNEHDWDPAIHGPDDPMNDPHGPMEYNRRYGLQRYHPDALRHITKRIPDIERDGNFERPDKAIVRLTLRDGTQHDVELFGLPPALEQHRKRVRQRLGYALRHEKTPEQVDKEATGGIVFKTRFSYSAPPGGNREYSARRARDKLRQTRLERRERALVSEAQQKAAESKKARRARRRDAQAQKALRQMERKRLPGVASLHAEQKKRLRMEREKQDKEKTKLEDEAEKRMKMQLARHTGMKKKKPKKVNDDDDKFVSESESDSESDSDNEDEDEEDVKDNGEDDDDDDEANEEAEEEEERWPSPPKWTKPEKKMPREPRYGGHAYKKGNRKPARLFRAIPDDLDVYD